MIRSFIQSCLRPVVTEAVNDAVGNAISVEAQRRKQEFDSLEKLRGACVAIGLKKFFEAKHFNICDLDTLIASARIIPDGELMRIVRPLHCVDWADIPKAVREDVARRIIGMFSEAA